MEKALFDQLNHEFSSAYLYLAMSAYCSHLEFNGAASWFKLQYEEEHIHATKIYNYLVEQGVQVVLGEVAKPPSEFGKLLDVFSASLSHEQSMTSRLNDLSDLALKEKDHATYNLLQWFVNAHGRRHMRVLARASLACARTAMAQRGRADTCVWAWCVCARARTCVCVCARCRTSLRCGAA